MKLITTLLIFNCLNIFASEQVYDLKTLLNIAGRNNPISKQAREKVNEFDADTKLTLSGLFPTVGWTLQSTYEKAALYTGSATMNGDPYKLYSSDLKLTQTLYAYGSISAVKQADLNSKIQSLTVEIQERSLTQNIIQAFYQFIVNQQTYANYQKTQQIIKTSLTTANDRYRTGRGQLLDVLQVKTQLALIEPQIEQARVQAENSANQISYYLGEKERSSFKLQGKLKSLKLQDIQNKINVNDYHLPEYEVNKLQIQNLEYTKDMTYGKDLPVVKLTGDYYYTNYKKADLFSDNSNSWAIALSVNIPLFSGLSTQDEKHVLASQEIQLYEAKRDLENSLSLNQVTSLRNLQSTEVSLESAEKAVTLAEQSQVEAARNYRLATIDFLQFLTVEQSALQAKINLDQLKYQSIVAYLNYFSASGQPLSILVDILSDGGKI